MSSGMAFDLRKYLPVIKAYALSCVFSLLLLFIGAIKAHSSALIFLMYNLAIAILPAVFAWWLFVRLSTKPWLNPLNIFITLLWLGTVPNSFYMISDLIHTNLAMGYDLLYQIVTIFSLIFNALVAGYVSVYIIHKQLIRRLTTAQAHTIIAVIFFACGFAIYLGRYLRWSSWDVIFNPAGILFDISDSLISPSTHPQFVVTTFSFFGLIGSIYIVIWQVAKILESKK